MDNIMSLNIIMLLAGLFALVGMYLSYKTAKRAARKLRRELIFWTNIALIAGNLVAIVARLVRT